MAVTRTEAWGQRDFRCPHGEVSDAERSEATQCMVER